MSQMTERVHDNLFYNPIVEIGAGESVVVDVRGCTSFTAWFDAGAGHTAQPCDEDGVALPGSSADALAAGDAVTVQAPFYEVTADGANALTITRSGTL